VPARFMRSYVRVGEIDGPSITISRASVGVGLRGPPLPVSTDSAGVCLGPRAAARCWLVGYVTAGLVFEILE
jgi:hypothetical protein